VSVAVVLALAWWLSHRDAAPTELTLYGNVDMREIDLAFNNSERIAAVYVREGDRVRQNQLLARADTSRLEPETEQAAANVELAKADEANARIQFQRLALLTRTSGGRGVATQDLDNARATLNIDIARAHANEAQLDLLRQELKDAQLLAPTDATVRTRVMEPGEMASPQRTVLELAVTDPKWVRVYVAETDLGKAHPGMAATVTADSFPGRIFKGWVGFVSSVSEFTPKNIETEDLRTSLVYEVRVFVTDPADDLRLGMPATVHLPLVPARASPAR
jgi:HlyD family secretion protein